MATRETKAVILAAGRSSKFFPPLYDRPKGLFTFRGEVLIERQIRQLIEAGVGEVWVVLGYEKERFFYLEDLFPQVRLVVNTGWAEEGNVASISCARDAFAKGAWLCCADHWYAENPFLGSLPERSVRMVGTRADASGEFAVSVAGDGRIAGIDRETDAGPCMVGAAYLTGEFVGGLLTAYGRDRGKIGVKGLFWEEFWGRHADELPLAAMPEPVGFREFDNLGDLRGEDAGVIDNVSREATENICRLLSCGRDEIEDIEPLNKGLTNASFSFRVRGGRYVYRQPGWSSGNMVNRRAEVEAQRAAISLGIDPSVIAIGEDGWKLSRYVEADHAFSYDDPADLTAGIAQLRRLHESGATCGYEVDLLAEGDRLIRLASSVKGDLAARYSREREGLRRLWHHLELDGARRVLCHNDAYAVNWICGAGGELCLIDWEYAGMNDPVNDLATLVVRDGLSQEKYEEIVRLYWGREPSFEEFRHAFGVCALSSWYWLGWALFKDTLGQDGYFMHTAWSTLHHYLPLALSMYGDASRAEGEGR